MTALALIQTELTQMLRDKGAETGDITADTPLLNGPFDIDSLDPGFAPGTGTPEIGGFSTHTAQRMVRRLQGLNLMGADLVEVSPPFDPTGMTAWVGVSIIFELLCVLADAVARRTGRAGLAGRAGQC